ncbi:hypothetical protein L345_15567, partial [Ophiophagus hannah]
MWTASPVRSWRLSLFQWLSDKASSEQGSGFNPSKHSQTKLHDEFFTATRAQAFLQQKTEVPS